MSESEVADGSGDGRVAGVRVGDRDYRGLVGPASQYDLMGAAQFSLLYALGIRATDRLLDIGCGSLRAGRLFIAYLDPGGYTGIEPNKWLVDEAVGQQIGHDALAIKTPVFVHNDQFDVTGLGAFEFVLANSIASHTGPAMMTALLRSIRQALAPNGIAAVTFCHSLGKDNTAEGWFYPKSVSGGPGTVSYRRQTIGRNVRAAGLKGEPIPWFHPRQTWWLLVPEESELPPRAFRRLAWGISLSPQLAQSWSPAFRAERRLKASVLELLPQSVRTAATGIRGAVSGSSPTRRARN
jgi:SAM-dependent methyltransferase